MSEDAIVLWIVEGRIGTHGCSGSESRGKTRMGCFAMM
jgi:hypothetical protein